MASNLEKFQQKLNLSFHNLDLLREALIHRSYLNEHKEVKLPHNERLEFLGDAVLELVVTDYLFKNYPTKPEGELTAIRAALVNATTCAEVAAELEMNDYLFLSKGESKDTGRAREIILANAYEALVGAIYLDIGYAEAARIIEETILVRTARVIKQNLWRDAKSGFQELAQESRGVTPVYKIISEAGPDHDKRFTVGLYLGAQEVARGEGHSKQEAEQAAAGRGLKVLAEE
jgi:ribonuclease-3